MKACLECGYILEGLSVPRCPECGQIFYLRDPTSYRNVPEPTGPHRAVPCSSCGYDVSRTAGTTCPRCGTSFRAVSGEVGEEPRSAEGLREKLRRLWGSKGR